MALKTWMPRARAVAEVHTITPANVEVGDVFTITINGKTVSFTATATTVANVTAGLAAAWALATEAEFTEITASDQTTHLRLTHNTPGVPFMLTATATDGGGTDDQTLTDLITVEASGPERIDDDANWAEGAAPADGDDAEINLTLGSVRFGLSNLSGVTVASLRIYTTEQTQNVFGKPTINPAGYVEYRALEASVGATKCVIDAESPLIRINFGAAQTDCEVRRSGFGGSPTNPPVQLRGTHVDNEWDFVGGESGLCLSSNQATNGAKLYVGPDATLLVGPGVDIDVITSEGTLTYQGSGDELIATGGTTVVVGESGWAELNAEGGTIDYRSSGTVGHASMGGREPGTIACTKDLTPRTFTDVTMKRGGRLEDPNHTVTITNGVVVDRDSVGVLSAA
jgi:hypothetical protein